MKIKGPGGPGDVPDIDAADGEATTAGAKGSGGIEGTRGGFAEKLGSADATAGVQGATGAHPADAVSADLRAGKITPEQAVDRLVDLAVTAGGGAALPDGVKAMLRAQLEGMLREDPFLSGMAKRAGLPAGDDEG